jgi:hypothetical protein
MARRPKNPYRFKPSLWPIYKIIDGKKYTLHSATKTKAKAKVEARRLRERRLPYGWRFLARVVSSDKPRYPWRGKPGKYAVYSLSVKKKRPKKLAKKKRR